MTVLYIIFAFYSVLCAISWVFARRRIIVIRIVPKVGPIWNFLGWLYRLLGDFSKFATTIGDICAVPPGVNLSLGRLCHETSHANDSARLGFGSVWFGLPMHALLYLFLPLPVGLAWFRYHFELKAYLAEGRPESEIVDFLAGPAYGWAWPRAWVKRALGL